MSRPRRTMAYDLHIVRTTNWLEASSAPITKQDVDALIASDPELTWSTADHLDMRDDDGAVTRYYMIMWRGQPRFWWHRDQIQCSGPDEAQQAKLVQMARALDAFAVGDDGEVHGGDGALPHRQTTSFGERVAGWLAGLRPQRRAGIEDQQLPFGVGDKVRDPWATSTQSLPWTRKPSAEWA